MKSERLRANVELARLALFTKSFISFLLLLVKIKIWWVLYLAFKAPLKILPISALSDELKIMINLLN